MKICCTCKTEKSLGEFTKDKTTKDGLRSRCRSCRKIEAIEYRERNLEKENKRSRLYYYKNREKQRIRSKRYREANRDRIALHRKEYRYKKYGLTINQVEEMRIKQRNKCLLCNKEFTPINHPCIDHDHETDEVRGLLHSKCNALLGFANDDNLLLLSAAIYIYSNRHNIPYTHEQNVDIDSLLTSLKDSLIQ